MLAAGYGRLPTRNALAVSMPFGAKVLQTTFVASYELGHTTKENRTEIERLVALAIEIGRKHEPKDVS